MDRKQDKQKKIRNNKVRKSFRKKKGRYITVLTIA